MKLPIACPENTDLGYHTTDSAAFLNQILIYYSEAWIYLINFNSVLIKLKS
jgi:hypothetical protein